MSRYAQDLALTWPKYGLNTAKIWLKDLQYNAEIRLMNGSDLGTTFLKHPLLNQCEFIVKSI